MSSFCSAFAAASGAKMQDWEFGLEALLRKTEALQLSSMEQASDKGSRRRIVKAYLLHALGDRHLCGPPTPVPPCGGRRAT